ncbi:unnamed protein product [Ceutorhynchus assimilis]|uniref:Serpin domain-containing protein n=1 Tax=Ceutorhynchus assimilis TaxID=467358 RepID=A0A9P0DFE3_9CUCU|nr:unnamed protein product [Ceutorhynchus assimilis]
MRRGNVEFTSDLYKEIAKTKSAQNFVYSPFTVQTLLAMLASADKTSNTLTVKEIRRVAHLPQDNPSTEQAFQSIITDMNKSTNDDFKIFDVTKFYFASGYNMEPWLKDIAERTFQAETETVNFTDPSNTASGINLWVAKKTDQKITNFFKQGDIARNTDLVLINALFVMGKWECPFEKEQNVRRTFYGQNGNSDVVMMNNLQSFEYSENAKAKYLKMELRRDGGGAQAVFILPHETDGLAKLEKQVQDLLQTPSFYAAKVDVTLPKFTINGDVNLNAVLKRLGLNQIFKYWVQDLTGFGYPGHPFSVITNLFQKSHIEVDEWGLTAASVAAAVNYVDDPPDTKVFVADHPFLFEVVVDDVVVYAERVVNL